MNLRLTHCATFVRYLFIAIALFLTACSGGGGSTTPTPSSTRNVYVADQDTAGVFELYLVDSASPGLSTKLNSALIASGNVLNFFISFDGTQVLYHADQDIDEQNELYLVSIVNPGVSTKVNSALIGNNRDIDTNGFAFSPDGTSILYRADHDIQNVFELYQVATAMPGVSTKLNPNLVDLRDVNSFIISPDSTSVIYHADQDVDDQFELYQVAIANPGMSTKLNPVLGVGETVLERTPVLTGVPDYILSPDGTSVVYRADQDTDDIFELYQVALATPGASTKLNDVLPADGDVADDFLFSNDGTQMFYRADQDIDDAFELYQVAIATPGVSTKLNPPLAATMDTAQTFAVSSDGTQVVYSADQDTLGVFELYQVATAMPGMSTKLNPAFGATADIAEAIISNDGSLVIYRADQDIDEAFELYQVFTATPGVSMKLNPALGATMDVAQSAATFPVLNGTPDFALSSDNSRVYYRADQDIVGVLELHEALIASPGASTKQNPALGAGMLVGGAFAF